MLLERFRISDTRWVRIPRPLSVLVAAAVFVAFLAVTGQSIDLSRSIILDVPAQKMEKQFGPPVVSLLSLKDSVEIASYRFDADTLKVIAILVEWSDRLHTYEAATIDSLLFSHWVFPGGSVADYFDEVSYGQLTIVGDVYGWHNAGMWNINFDFDPLLATLDPVIDYSQYDGNNDGDVDAVIFVRTGNGEEDSQDPNDMWSYASVGPPGVGEGPFDGKIVNRWNTSPETKPERNPDHPVIFLGSDTLNHIRVFCHELAHNLGLPDLYDYDAKLDVATYETPGDDNDHPLVDWCLMGYYGYGYMSVGSIIPSHLCGWSKMRLGWVDPVVLFPVLSGEYIVLDDIETHSANSLYKLPIDIAEGEYFLLEYRNPQSTAMFDKTDSDFSLLFWPEMWGGWDTLDAGLIITHIHDSLTQTWRINDGTPNLPHYSVAVEDAGYNPVQSGFICPPDYAPNDSGQCWYPWEIRKAAAFSSETVDQDVFSPATTPNSDGYAGPTGFTIRVDSIVGDQLFAYVEGNQASYATIASSLALNPLCHFNAPPGGSDATTLTIFNYGTADLIAITSVSAGDSWLSITGGGTIVIPPGSPPEVLPVTMDASGLSEGTYEGEITIDHNGDSQPSPIHHRVRFRVDGDYTCADSVTLRTAVASPGVLSLSVVSAGGYGLSDYAGLRRSTDESWSLYDASLVIAHSGQATDTVAYNSIYNVDADEGSSGFLSESPLEVDTSAYGTGVGNATASYTMQSRDGVIEVATTWYFPQDPDSADFVIAKNVVKNVWANNVSDILVGQLIDFDVTPGELFTSYQQAVNNHGHYVPEENLVYQFGYTIPGIPTNPPLELAERYSAGIAYLSGRDYAGTGLSFSQQQVGIRGGTGDLWPLSQRLFDGTSSGLIYEKLVGPAEVTIWEGFPDADSSSDLYTYLCLDQGLTLAPGDSQTYVVAFVADTLSHPDMPIKAAAATDLVTTVQKAKAWAADHGIIESIEACSCPNQGDLEPDGFLTALDLAGCIDVLFAGQPDVQDSGCPSPRFDLDCDGFSTALDLAVLIDHLFAGGDGPCEPCAK